MHYKLYTLVDITNTRQYQNSTENRQARSQQQNFDTVIQTIGMRANVDYTKPPEVTIDVPKKYNLDSAVLSNIWIFEWRVEREFLFLAGDVGGHQPGQGREGRDRGRAPATRRFDSIPDAGGESFWHRRRVRQRQSRRADLRWPRIHP